MVAELLPSKPSFVIGDGHDFPYYETRLLNEHGKLAKDAVWFGYSPNSRTLPPFFSMLHSRNLRLRIISDSNPFPGQLGIEFSKWNLNTCVREISQADFALLPTVAPYKSNNKDITALLCGIPVAKTSDDVIRLMYPDERKKAMRSAAAVILEHDVRDRAREYRDLVQGFVNKRNPAVVSMELPPPKKNVAHVDAPTLPVDVYTAICGEYEKSRNGIQVFNDSPSDRFKEPVMNAKVYKILPHLFTKSPYRIWVDGNIFPKRDSSEIIKELLGDHDIATYKHPWRNCLYAESQAARGRLKPEYWPLLDAQVAQYRQEGMPTNFGLAECGVLISRDNATTREFFERWWGQVTRYSSRDQVSFPYVWWKMQDRIKIRLIEAPTRFGPHFEYREHGR
jgi:hypothetical protein